MTTNHEELIDREELKSYLMERFQYTENEAKQILELYKLNYVCRIEDMGIEIPIEPRS